MMKRNTITRALALTALLLCLPLAAAAQTFAFTHEGVTLNYKILDGTAKTCEVTAQNQAEGKIAIPADTP